LIAGCSAGATGTAGSAQPQAPKPLSARTAISLAADQTQRVNSMAATFSVQISGSVAETVAGTMQTRLRPALLADASLNVSAAGQKFPLNEIVTAKAFYLKSPAFAALAKPGRPWIEIRLSALSGNMASSLGSLLQNVQNGNPASQTRVLSASKDVHVVGTRVIDGVSTTHYVGTVKASAALATLSPSQRKELAPALKLITGDIRFNIWLDAQHVARRITESYVVMGETVNLAVNVTAVNQPVHILLPRASRTTIPSASAFGV
jgi:class 3 adenylate cyclase